MIHSQVTKIADLQKALEAGQYDAKPSSLVQGSALQTENLANVMINLGFEDEQIVLQKLVKTKPCRSTLAQFDRQLSYGQFGGSAGLEGAVGQEDTGDFVRIVVPMCYYSQVRKTTLVADMVDTVDGMSGSDRQAEGAAKVILGDVEFDSFRGMDDFSNAGFFDGNPLTMSDMPNMRGLFLQVRQSDSQLNSHDLMFDEFGSDETVDIAVNGFLDQNAIENARMRAQMNHSQADIIVSDPRVVSQYNKTSFALQRIVLAGSPQDATGADLNKQWTSGGPANIKASRFLSGKTSPGRPRANGPAAPAAPTGTSTTVAATPTTFLIGQVYKYTVTAVNEIGESQASGTLSQTVAASGDVITLTITKPAGTVRHYNVYRSVAGGRKMRFIGRVRDSGSATTAFIDLNLRIPGFVTTVLFDQESAELAEMAPYSRLKLGIHELAKPEAHFRFITLKVYKPRNNVLLSNCTGTYLDQ
jgi:hypothetical protein